MRYVLCSLCLAFTACHAPAPPLNPPQTYQTQRAILASEPIPTGAILFVGDSLIAGVEWDRFLANPAVVSLGIGGDRLHWLHARLRDLDLQRATAIHLEIGINDVLDGRPADVISQEYRDLVAELHQRAPAARLYAHPIMPTRDPDLIPTRQAVNAALRRLPHLTVLDIAGMSDPDGRIRPGFAQADGVHLTLAGYQAWRRAIPVESLH